MWIINLLKSMIKMKDHERKIKILKKQIAELIPILESSIQSSGCKDVVVIDEVEIKEHQLYIYKDILIIIQVINNIKTLQRCSVFYIKRL